MCVDEDQSTKCCMDKRLQDLYLKIDWVLLDCISLVMETDF